MARLRIKMVSWLKFLLILIEWGVQLKRRDEHEKKQERLREARTNPAKYLRRFGRVQRESAEDVHGGGTGTDRHDSQ